MISLVRNIILINTILLSMKPSFHIDQAFLKHKLKESYLEGVGVIGL